MPLTYDVLYHNCQELIKIDQAILRIPNLAIHLQTAKEREAFKVNKEDHLAPIIASSVKESLDGDKKKDEDKSSEEGEEEDNWKKNQEPLLVQLLASELDVNEKDIVDFELNLFDIQPANFGGVRSEFLHSARLDNLASCFLSLRGGVEKDDDVSMIAMFDHEEGKWFPLNWLCSYSHQNLTHILCTHDTSIQSVVHQRQVQEVPS